MTNLTLTDQERTELLTHAKGDHPSRARRATLILGYADGKTTAELVPLVGLSDSQARRWRRTFIADRMAIFTPAIGSGRRPPAEKPKPKTKTKNASADPKKSAAKSPKTKPARQRPTKSAEKSAEKKTARRAKKAAAEMAAENAAQSVIEGTIEFPTPTDTQVTPTDTLIVAAKKVLYRQFLTMLAKEPGTREGSDIEELHDMRVAVRRQRAAFEVFADAFNPKIASQHLKGLRAVGRALGRVRDLDVFMEKAHHYLESHPDGDQHGLDPLLTAWQAERDADRAEMLAFLDSDRYAHFKTAYLAFLTDPAEGLPKDHDPRTAARVAHVLPILAFSRLAVVRAYDAGLPNASITELHALRIDFKKLRYTLEFFRDVLGAAAKPLIDEIKRMQDHLGDLNDADVAASLLSDWLTTWDDRHAGLPLTERPSSEPVAAYLAAKHAERHHLIVTFPTVWARFNTPEWRAQLAEALGAL